jgi:hypothetical protein
LSKSNNASANKVTLELVATGATGAAALGAAGAATTGAGLIAPSQSAAAVAGVQLASLQHKVASAPERTAPAAEFQLSTVVCCACATPKKASKAKPNNIERFDLVIFFLIKSVN